MSESEAQADAITAEDTLYAGVISEFQGLRRNGGGWIESALLTMTHLVVINTISED